MALNRGESLYSGIKIENRRFLEDRPDCLGKSWGFDCGKASDDVADLLPHDPFDMDIKTTVSELTGITSWIEDLELDLGLQALGFVTDEVDDQLFAGLDFVWRGSEKMNETSMDLSNGLFDGHLFMDFSYEKYWIFDEESGKNPGFSGGGFDGEGGDPPDALFLALSYLAVEDLLSVGQVCKSLRDAVRNDPLIWRRITIDHPLSDKITDSALLQLTNMAQGQLHCLSLVECLKITDFGLKNVLQRNSRLTKLSVAGCMKLSIDGLLSSLKAFNCPGNPGIKRLRIGGLFGVTNQHYEELKLLLGGVGSDSSHPLTARSPRFYRGGQLYLSVDDDQTIDIETCPKCQQLRLVYDCPAESCQETQQLCRACTFCISRCKSCGCCLSNCDYEETFCLENLCSDCVQKFLPKHPFFHPQASYHFFLCG